MERIIIGTLMLGWMVAVVVGYRVLMARRIISHGKLFAVTACVPLLGTGLAAVFSIGDYSHDGNFTFSECVAVGLVGMLMLPSIYLKIYTDDREKTMGPRRQRLPWISRDR